MSVTATMLSRVTWDYAKPIIYGGIHGLHDRTKRRWAKDHGNDIAARIPLA